MPLDPNMDYLTGKPIVPPDPSPAPGTGFDPNKDYLAEPLKADGADYQFPPMPEGYGTAPVSGTESFFDALAPLITAGVTVGIAAAVGYGLYRLINVANPQTPSDWGRRWLSWSLFLACISQLPSFFRHLDSNSFAVWVLISVVLGALGFSIGWVYGKLFKLGNSSSTRPTSAVTSNTNTSESVDEQYYEVAWNEVKLKRVNEGLWAKAYAEADGNKEKITAIYLKSRAKQLRDQARSRQAQENSE